MNTIQVKPAPDLPAAAAKVIVHPASGGLLDASGKVPADGRPWLYDGFTCRMLTEGVIVYADDPVHAAIAAADAARALEEAEAAKKAQAIDTPAPPPETPPETPPAPEADPAH